MSNYFDGKRCLVTGSAGFIGSKLASTLTRLGAIVFGVDHHPRVSSSYTGVCDRPWLNAIFIGHKPQVVFHLAAQTEVLKANEEPYSTFVANVVGTMNVLECCRLSSQIESVVVASSDKAYGDKPASELPYCETMPLASAGDFYAATKRGADQFCDDYARLYALPVRVMRAANTYGPGQRNATTLITKTVQKILAGEQPIVYRQYEHVLREWLYIDDAVSAYLHLAEDAKDYYSKGGQLNQVAYNVGSGETASVANIVNQICTLLGYCGGYKLVDSPSVQIGDQYLDSAKFRAMFPAWQPTQLSVGLDKTIAWYRNQFTGMPSMTFNK